MSDQAGEIADAYAAFVAHRAVETEREGHVRFSNDSLQLLCESLAQVLGGDVAEAYVFVPVHDDVLILVIVGDAAHVVSMQTRGQAAVTINFLGRLVGGRYREILRRDEVRLCLEHERLDQLLDGGRLELDIAPTPERAQVATPTRAQAGQLDAIRRKFRVWAALPPDAAS